MDVSSSPKFTARLVDRSVVAGYAAAISCAVRGFPKVFIYIYICWPHLKTVLLPSDTKPHNVQICISASFLQQTRAPKKWILKSFKTLTHLLANGLQAELLSASPAFYTQLQKIHSTNPPHRHQRSSRLSTLPATHMGHGEPPGNQIHGCLANIISEGTLG